jgi:putative nucleotidyltransferase with HDIG domain
MSEASSFGENHKHVELRGLEEEKNLEIIKRVEEFVAQEFEKHPHYSFNDWRVMFDHSVKVKEIALVISETLSLDTTVVAIGALLHDIGKTYEADVETLHTQHEDYNLPVSEQLLNTIGLSEDQVQKLKQIISHKSDSLEMQVVEDADALALYADKRLYTLFITWARENKLDKAIQRKIDKFGKLHFEKSKKIGEEWFEQMKKDWGV